MIRGFASPGLPDPDDLGRLYLRPDRLDPGRVGGLGVIVPPSYPMVYLWYPVKFLLTE